MRIVAVAGARPNFMKIAPLMWEISRRADIGAYLVHTGQHYDERMSQLVLRGARNSPPGHRSGRGIGQPRSPDGRGHEAVRAGGPRAKARRRGRRRRRQLDDRLRPDGRQAGGAGGPRRGGPAQLRPHHARGDQPHPHRRDQPLAVRDRAQRSGQPAAGGSPGGPRLPGRQRHDRHPAGLPGAEPPLIDPG